MHQSAAIPFIDDRSTGLRILLITSTTRGRWILPKGNILRDQTPHLSAAREALEEAGVVGTVSARAAGNYRQVKIDDGAARQIVVTAFPLAVARLLQQWPEMERRERRWFSAAEIQDSIEDTEIKTLLLDFIDSRSIGDCCASRLSPTLR